MKKILLFIIFSCATVASYAQITWETAVDVAANTYSNRLPRITLDGNGNPLILWGKTNAHDAYFSRWDGTQFTTPLALNQTNNVFADSWAGPGIASKGDTVYAVFKKMPENSNPVLITRSFDGGVTFSTPDSVESIGDSLSRFPVVAVDNSGNPLVGFMKFNSMFMNSRWVVARSDDYGNNFSTDVPAGEYSGGEACDCCPATLLSSGNYAALLYRDNLNNTRDMWAGVSSDNGATFPNGIDLDDTDWLINACPSSGPDGVIIGDSLYSIFMSSVSGTSLVYYSSASLNDTQAGQSKRVTGIFSGLTFQNYPRIAKTGNTVAMAWMQTVNGMDETILYLSDTISAGISLPVDYDVVASSMNELPNVDVAISPGVVHVVWQDNGSGTVKYRKGTYPLSTSINEQAATSFTVYPNPVLDNTVAINFNNPVIRKAEYTITNLAGQCVVNGSGAVENSMLKADVTSLAAGTYFIKIIADNQSSISKIIKQ